MERELNETPDKEMNARELRTNNNGKLWTIVAAALVSIVGVVGCSSNKTSEQKEENQPITVEVYNDYDEGLRVAKEQGKPVFLDFSGWGCVNSREMEDYVLNTPEIQKIFSEEYVCITLYVDDKTKLPETITMPDGTNLRSVGQKWSYLQRTKFGACNQPYYVLLDHEGNSLLHSYGYDKDRSPEKLKVYLEKGIKEYEKTCR